MKLPETRIDTEGQRIEFRKFHSLKMRPGDTASAYDHVNAVGKNQPENLKLVIQLNKIEGDIAYLEFSIGVVVDETEAKDGAA